MQFFSWFVILVMVVFCGYAVWDIKVTGNAQPFHTVSIPDTGETEVAGMIGDGEIVSSEEVDIAMPENLAQAEETGIRQTSRKEAQLADARAAYAAGEYERAIAGFETALAQPADEPAPQVYVTHAAAYAEQINALRALGRKEEAEALRAAIRGQIETLRASREIEAATPGEMLAETTPAQ